MRFLSLAPLIYRGRCQSQEKGIMRTKKRSGDDIPTSITVGSLKPVIQALIAIASLLIPAPHYQHAPISRSCFSHSAYFNGLIYGAPMFQSSSHEISFVSLDHVVMVNFHDPRFNTSSVHTKRYCRSIT